LTDQGRDLMLDVFRTPLVVKAPGVEGPRIRTLNLGPPGLPLDMRPGPWPS
jgi:hypothetical protein